MMAVWDKDQYEFYYTDFNSELVHTAIMVIEKAGIKSLDAIQLASAYLFSIDIFVTADKVLAKAAERILNKKVILIS